MTECIVDDAKVREYLLNLDHPDGAPKARFFIGGGFSRDRSAEFIDALRSHFLENQPAPKKPDKFGGIKIIVDAPMFMPDGRAPIVRTVWTIDRGDKVARLITAYPLD